MTESRTATVESAVLSAATGFLSEREGEQAASAESSAIVTLPRAGVETEGESPRSERDDHVIARLGECCGGVDFGGCGVQQLDDGGESAVVSATDDAMRVHPLGSRVFGNGEPAECDAQVGEGPLRFETCVGRGAVGHRAGTGGARLDR